MRKIIALSLCVAFLTLPALAVTKKSLTKGQKYCKTVSFNQSWVYRLCMKPYVGNGDLIDHGFMFWRH